DIPLAIENFKKSVAIYEKDPSDLDSNWQYLNALVWLGQAYLANDQKKEALETFKKCLDLAPEFGWVKHHLLAKAEKVK
ncbi:MAG: tetratricopeptide repeat protein, partial [Bacteroidota bacterium]